MTRKPNTPVPIMIGACWLAIVGALAASEFNLADFSRVMRRWGVDEGLTGGRVDAVAQTPDGHLWVGTEDGLFRFNGRRFDCFKPPVTRAPGHSWVGKLCADRAGDLWVLTSNKKITRFDGSAFHEVDLQLDVEDARFWAHPEGGVLTAIQLQGGARILWLKADGVSVLAERLSAIATAILATRDGRVWVGLRDRPLAELKSGKLVPLENGAAVGAGAFVERRDGTLLAVARDGIHAWKDGQWLQETRFEPAWAAVPGFAVEDLDGRIWAGTPDVERIVWEKGKPVTRLRRGRPSTPAVVQCAMVDADGDLWLGSYSGLFQLRYSPFVTWKTPKEMATERVVGLRTRPDGTIWFNGFGGISRLSPGAAEPVFVAERPSAELTSCDADESGSLWITNERAEFIHRAGDTETRVPLQGVTGRQFSLTIAVDDAGVAWATTFSGLFRCDPKVSPLAFSPVGEAAGLPAQRCHMVRVQANGDLLAASRGHGVFRLPAGTSRWQRATPEGDAAAAESGLMDQDEEGQVWGLARGPGVIGRWTPTEGHVVRLADIGLDQVKVEGLTVDRDGGLWLATRSHGVACVSRDEMLAAMTDPSRKPVIHWFDQASGLGSTGGSYTADCIRMGRDGRVWVATDGGLSVIDPRQWRVELERARAPETFIEECLADGERVDRNDPIQLAAGTSIVELHYAARSFATPGEVTYRCRLRGLDDAWRDTGTLSQVSFQQLEPGDYEFEVVASNRYGKTFPQPAALKLTMLPFWWQRTDARLLIALALAGALALLVKMRINALRARFALHEEFSRQLIISQEQERRRIAGEIHDSLGQNLLIAKNQLYLVRQMECPDAVQGKLAQVGGSVDDALNEARAISHRLRPFQLERLGLAKAMRAVVRETSESTRIPIEAQIESVDGLLPSESETMLFRVLQEALSNVIKHADASKVGVHVAKSGTRIRMRIEDDGRGFDVKSTLDPGRGTAGLGLAGFKERAHLLHGTFHCHSAPGEGTVLTFEIPIPDTQKHEAKS